MAKPVLPVLFSSLQKLYLYQIEHHLQGIFLVVFQFYVTWFSRNGDSALTKYLLLLFYGTMAHILQTHIFIHSSLSNVQNF